MSLHDKIMNIEPIDLFEYKDQFPILQLLSECPQDKKWHSEGDVLIHTNMVLEVARELCKDIPRQPDKINVYLGALMHDFGKPLTTFEKYPGKLVAYGHEGVGMTAARRFLRDNFDFDLLRREYILSLVEFHGHPKRMMKDKSKDNKFLKLSLDVNTHQVHAVEIADFKGRIGESADVALQMLENFKLKCKDMGIWNRHYIIPNSAEYSTLLYSLLRWDILNHNLKLDTDSGKRRFDTLSKLADKEPFELMIMVGTPGSGKTTHAETVYSHVNRISMDDERLKICGDINDMSKNQEVYDNCFSRLRDNMRNRVNTIWDSTSVGRKLRKRLIEMARQHGAMISIIYFDLSFDEVMRRNKGRDRIVPDDVIKKFYSSMEFPKSYECERLLIVNEKTPLVTHV